MTVEESELNQTKWRRMRRVKKWLRPLPMSTNIHSYRILRFFAVAARKRTNIWSFRVENAVPAIYAGSILTLMPLYGIQIPSAFLLALLLRANLPIPLGLQVVSNPLTILPIWFAAYQIGQMILSVVGLRFDPLNQEEVRLLLDNFIYAAWGDKLDNLAATFSVTILGAIAMSIFFGLISSFTYRIVTNHTAASYTLLRHKITLHKLKNAISPLQRVP